MKRLIELTDPPAESPRIFIEINELETSGGVEPASAFEGVVEHARQAFDAALDSVTATTQAISQKLLHLTGEMKPSEYEVEFGLAFKGESGLIVTSGSLEANFKVTLKWK